ncbi:hypothetical protein NQ318_010651 [Aromia moschata]|uniref:Uncharacterized protein n=1 Tax=Aromia moschata TaxID=1265417 RepID=A0AAV8XCP0_9CUCU|nr:hypothetical protein NQ318_010651 [Aromia moschata]
MVTTVPLLQKSTQNQASGALEEHRRMREYLRRMERDGVQRVKMFLVITAAYVLFWGPLFFVTLVNHPLVGNPLGHESLKRKTHPDLPPLNQGTISKIEAQYREMGHVRKVPSKRQAVVDDDTKLNLLLALEENPITPAHNPTHIIRARHRQPHAVPGAPPRPEKGDAGPVLRLDTPVAGVAQRAAAPQPPRSDISLLKPPLPVPAHPDSSMVLDSRLKENWSDTRLRFKEWGRHPIRDPISQ